MTLLILYPYNEVGAQRYVGPVYVGVEAPNDRAAEMLGATRAEHPDAFLAEPLTGSASAKGALPGELARAIEAWNAMPKEVAVPRLRGNLARLVSPYRKWKREAGQRDYLLEDLVADIASTPFCWAWIRFPWLFGKKNGELNSEKLHGEVTRGGWREAPEITEQQFAQLAARVARWQRDFASMFAGDPGGSDISFQREVGYSWPKWVELRQRFDPQAAAE